ncbi:type IV pilus biogenesis protein PilM [Patescibacteria group bacterium]
MILPKSFVDTTTYFGISIDRSSIKAVSLKKDGSISSYAQHPLKNNTISNEIADPKALEEGFKNVKDQGSFSTPYVSVVIPESLAYSREFSLPKVKLEEFNEAISWQVKDIFPFAEDEVYTDWKLLHQDDKTITALVIAVPKKIIDTIRLSLSKVGLFPVNIEPAVSALSRVVTLENKPLVGLLEVDQNGSSASLIENGISLLTTTNPHNNQQDVTDTLTFAIQSLSHYYQTKKKKDPSGMELYISGNKASNELASSLANKVNLKVSVLDIKNITPSFHQAYAAASSQALSPESEISINLIPQDLQEWYQGHHLLSIYKKTSKILTVIFIILTLLAIGNTSYLTLLKNQAISSLASQPPLDQKVINTANIIKKANRVNKLFPEKIGPQEELVEALSLVPETIKVESATFEISTNTFQMFGVSANREDLIQFKNDLESSEIFHKVSLPLGVLTSKENANFSIKFTIKPPTK